MKRLERVTTEYSATEDRVRLSGAVPGGATIVIWLTRRLLEKLLPVLLDTLHREGGEDHRFPPREVAAKPQTPVRADESGVRWLARQVDINPSRGGLVLTFRGGEEDQATLGLSMMQLHQWLAILYAAYAKAEWPLTPWPAWFSAQQQMRAAPGSALMH